MRHVTVMMKIAGQEHPDRHRPTEGIQQWTASAVEYRKLHRGTMAREKIPSQGADKSSDVQESRLEAILKAIAGVHDSVNERLAPSTKFRTLSKLKRRCRRK